MSNNIDWEYINNNISQNNYYKLFIINDTIYVCFGYHKTASEYNVNSKWESGDIELTGTKIAENFISRNKILGFNHKYDSDGIHVPTKNEHDVLYVAICYPNMGSLYDYRMTRKIQERSIESKVMNDFWIVDCTLNYL